MRAASMVMANEVARTACGVVIDVGRIGADGLPSSIDESRIEGGCGVNSIDAVPIDAR